MKSSMKDKQIAM